MASKINCHEIRFLSANSEVSLMDMEELTDNKSIANQINIEAMTISTLASSLKTKHGVNIQYDAIIQVAHRLFDLANHIKNIE